MRFLKTTAFLIAVILLQSFTSYGQKDAPPGTIRLDDSTYIDRVVITNLDLREFIYFMLNWNNDLDCLVEYTSSLPLFGNSSDTLQPPKKCLPQKSMDSTHYLSDFRGVDMVQLPDTNLPLFNYFSSPRGASLPAVHVTYDLAQAYCRWRSYAVLMQWSTSKNAKARGKMPKQIGYRLPTAEEYRRAAKILEKNRDFKYPMFHPNGSELLVELTDNYGSALSWVESAEEKMQAFQYEYASTMIGFRCVCDILEEDL